MIPAAHTTELEARAPSARWVWTPPSGGSTRLVRSRFRREVVLGGPAATAELTLSARTRYRLRVNGTIFGGGPARSYPEHREADTHGLRACLHAGPNRIEVEVLHVAFATFHHLDEPPGFIAWGAIVEQNGTRHALDTPGVWRCQRQECVSADAPCLSFAQGPIEIVDLGDARDAEVGWTTPVDAVASLAAMVPRTIPPLTRLHRSPTTVRRATLPTANVAVCARVVAGRDEGSFVASAPAPVAAARSWLHSPCAQRVRVDTWWGAFWLNGAPLAKTDGADEPLCQSMTLDLRAGWNRVQARGEIIFGYWEFCFAWPQAAVLSLRLAPHLDAEEGVEVVGPVAAALRTGLERELADDPAEGRLDWRAVRSTALTESPLRSLAWSGAAPTAETLLPAVMSGLTRERVLADMGQIVVGTVTLDIEGPAGTVVDIGHAEQATPDGRPDYAKAVTVYAADRFVLAGGRQRIETFDPRGFRHLEVQVSAANAPVTLHALGAVEQRYPYAFTGEFAQITAGATAAFNATAVAALRAAASLATATGEPGEAPALDTAAAALEARIPEVHFDADEPHRYVVGTCPTEPLADARVEQRRLRLLCDDRAGRADGVRVGDGTPDGPRAPLRRHADVGARPCAAPIGRRDRGVGAARRPVAGGSRCAAGRPGGGRARRAAGRAGVRHDHPEATTVSYDGRKCYSPCTPYRKCVSSRKRNLPMNDSNRSRMIRVHESVPRADLRIWIDGVAADALAGDVADFVCCSCAGAIDVVVETPQSCGAPVIRPLTLGVTPVVADGRTTFTLPGPMRVVLEWAGRRPLYLFAGSPLREADRPTRGAPGVRWFGAGAAHEAGEIRLRDGETLYIEEGAVVHGWVCAQDACGVRILGGGVLDGGGRRGGSNRPAILLERCRNASVEGVVLVRPAGWTLVVACCERVRVSSIKEITDGGGSDGVDVCASRDVTIEDCFLSTGDDCVAIKSVGHWLGDVEAVRVRRCMLYPHNGTAMEIGHETRCSTIRDIVFSDCTVLGVHGFGSVFGIHNGDRAEVGDVLYENIRVEHCYHLLIDFRIMRSRFNHDAERGSIRRVTLRNIDWVKTLYNDGYTVSLIGGYDAAHRVEGVVAENFRIDGRRIASADELDLHTRHADAMVVC